MSNFADARCKCLLDHPLTEWCSCGCHQFEGRPRGGLCMCRVAGCVAPVKPGYLFCRDHRDQWERNTLAWKAYMSREDIV